jgi:hypothetical protein
MTADSLAEPVALPFPPMHIRIAANHPLFSYYVSPYFSTIESILALQGFQVSLENSVPNSVERLELEYALQRTSDVLIPAITQDKTKEADSLQAQVRHAIVSIGRLIQAFDNTIPLKAPQETTPKATGKRNASKVDLQQANTITPNDASIFDSLRHYAESLSMPKEQALFATMNQTLEKEWQKTKQ